MNTEAQAKQFRVQPQYAVATSHLIGLLENGKPGEEFTDGELKDTCGGGMDKLTR